uniref:SFRICE_013929 n=1 Tax=Spodoptera frugiperda TaxID=7108 RepID=A0A2H1WZU4_SPOFR
MFRILFLLCCVAVSTHGYLLGPWPAGLKMKYGFSLFGMGSRVFIDLPRSNTSAVEKGWQSMNRPRRLSGYCPLQLWCPIDDFTVCVHTDETGYVAGVQIAIPESKFTPIYDMKAQGFTIWTTTFKSKIVRFWVLSTYFVSSDRQTRIASQDAEKVLRDDNVYFNSFNGVKGSVSTSLEKLSSVYTQQACIGWLGRQYTYNMTSLLECSSTTISPWAPFYYSGQLVGLRFMVFGTLKLDKSDKDSFEYYSHSSVKSDVPKASKCFYNAAKATGAIAMTLIFNNNHELISCVLE